MHSRLHTVRTLHTLFCYFFSTKDECHKAVVKATSEIPALGSKIYVILTVGCDVGVKRASLTLFLGEKTVFLLLAIPQAYCWLYWRFHSLIGLAYRAKVKETSIVKNTLWKSQVMCNVFHQLQVDCSKTCSVALPRNVNPRREERSSF